MSTRVTRQLRKTHAAQLRDALSRGGEGLAVAAEGADSRAPAIGRPRKGSQPKKPAPEETGAETVVDLVWQAYQRYPCDEHRNRLVELYKSFVDEIVRRFANRLPRRVDRGDLDTAANVGLMSAISAYDPTRGVRFECYCERRVRGALLDELRTQDWLPRHWRQRIEHHKRVLERLRGESNREPSDDEVARAMDMALDVYAQTFGIGLPGLPARSISSMEAIEEVGSGLEAVADRRSDVPGEQLTRDELLQLVAQKLSELEYRIVYLKYWEELPMREIGALTGLSESRVCKIHAKLLLRLQDRFQRD